MRPLAAIALPFFLLAAGCSSDKATDTTAAAETTAASVAGTGDVDTIAAAADTTAAATSDSAMAADHSMADTTASSASAALTTKTAGKLVVCSDIPYAPFEYYSNGADGDVVGIDADIVDAVAATLSLKAKFIKTPFDGIFAALAAGNCDMIASSVTITPERAQSNDFSQGYYTIQQTILVRSSDAALNDLPALKGKTVGVQTATTGAAFADAAASANGYTTKAFQGADDMITALKAGQVDAVIQDSPVNGYAATQSNGELTISKVFDGAGEEYGFVVPKDNPGLTAALNSGIDALRADGTYKTILVKYLGGAAPK